MQTFECMDKWKSPLDDIIRSPCPRLKNDYLSWWKLFTSLSNNKYLSNGYICFRSRARKWPSCEWDIDIRLCQFVIDWSAFFSRSQDGGGGGGGGVPKCVDLVSTHYERTDEITAVKMTIHQLSQYHISWFPLVIYTYKQLKWKQTRDHLKGVRRSNIFPVRRYHIMIVMSAENAEAL